MRSLLNEFFRRLFGWNRQAPHPTVGMARTRRNHVIIIDGTMCVLTPEGHETNAGLSYKLVSETGAALVHYEAGIQWRDWSSTLEVALGRGINEQIRRAYGVLASRYRPGDRIYLIGYSRGAYAVRSLAGVIAKVGLVQAEQATMRNIRQAYRHYQQGADSAFATRFKAIYCHPDTPIEMIAVWDTVRALGNHLPLFARWTAARHLFHDHHLANSVKHGYQALAADENRQVFAPILWRSSDDRPGEMKQMWFRGSHADIGGQVGGFPAARPLANISLVWLLSRAEECGLPLPRHWKNRFHRNSDAPSVGTWHGWSKFFLRRKRRLIGQDPSEQVYEIHHNETAVAVSELSLRERRQTPQKD